MADPFIIREIRTIATGTSTLANAPTDAGSFVLPQAGRLVHVSVVPSVVNAPPIWISISVNVENKGLLLKESWLRGFGGVGGGGFAWEGEVVLSRKGTAWLQIFVRNDTGATVSYVVQGVVG